MATALVSADGHIAYSEYCMCLSYRVPPTLLGWDLVTRLKILSQQYFMATALVSADGFKNWYAYSEYCTCLSYRVLPTECKYIHSLTFGVQLIQIYYLTCELGHSWVPMDTLNVTRHPGVLCLLWWRGGVVGFSSAGYNTRYPNYHVWNIGKYPSSNMAAG